jgi:hypothetical protein
MRGYDREGGSVTWVDPWFGRPYDPANPFAAFESRETAPPPTPPTPPSPRFRWMRALKACPSRVRAGCGCNGRFECRLREMAEVSLEDCRICLEARETARE